MGYLYLETRSTDCIGGEKEMVEEIREIKITIYVDTNKATYEKTFTDIEEAKEYLENLIARIGNY